jgi:hypothetical protein
MCASFKGVEVPKGAKKTELAPREGGGALLQPPRGCPPLALSSFIYKMSNTESKIDAAKTAELKAELETLREKYEHLLKLTSEFGGWLIDADFADGEIWVEEALVKRLKVHSPHLDDLIGVLESDW